MEHGVISTQLGGVISRSRAIGGSLRTDCPPVVFVPISVVGAANIGHSTRVGFADDGFAKAHTGAKSIGDAAVAYHDAILSRIDHGVYIRNAKSGISPAGFTAMSSVIDVAAAFIGIGDNGGIAGAGDIVEIGVGSDAIAGVEVLCGAIIDGPVAVSGTKGAVLSGNHHGFSQIAEVGHLSLFESEGLVDDVGELCG